MHEPSHIKPALTRSLIYKNLPASTKLRLSNLAVFDTIPSTNDHLLKDNSWHSEKFTACIANQQTQGRGRNGKTWASPPDSNIYLSIAKTFTASSSQQIQCLSLACGVTVAGLLHNLGINADIKWPNDILFNDRKLAGVLIETKIKGNKVRVIAGIGLNVNMPKTHSIDQPWVDLGTAIAQGPLNKQASVLLERNSLAALLLNELMHCLLQYEAYGFAPFKNNWIKFDILKNRSVVIETDQQTVNATVLGINNDCSLNAAVNNQKQTFYAADIRLKM